METEVMLTQDAQQIPVEGCLVALERSLLFRQLLSRDSRMPLLYELLPDLACRRSRLLTLTAALRVFHHPALHQYGDDGAHSGTLPLMHPGYRPAVTVG